MGMSHLPLPLQISTQHSQWSPSPLTVNIQSGLQDSCLQIVIPPMTVKQNSGEEVSYCVGEQEYHLGALKAKPSRTCWELGERSVCPPPWWDEMLWGWQAGERNLCRMPDSCCSANGRLKDVTYFQRTVCTEWHYLEDDPVRVSSKFPSSQDYANPRKLFPWFLLFAAKNTTALLFCQIITSASSYWLSFWFVSQIEESIIYKDTRGFRSFQLHRNQEFTKTQSGYQKRWECQLST